MAFTAKILSWRFRHLNIVGCLLKRRPTRGVTGTPGPPLATSPVKSFLYLAKPRMIPYTKRKKKLTRDLK